ncbi:Sodium/potassium-transporting ATPase subunit beta-3 [Tupaia chinensis]|uniref:Sodium/potassium-transporting ATPase subunit beta-3 n=1 Tax=Tupaia chinensis TaxID=246437 RepID=L9KNM5_TUPCH|nr:Sodium/potassium-transporting ATPase subunit beta-3 [Tupaia chinensis]
MGVWREDHITTRMKTAVLPEIHQVSQREEEEEGDFRLGVVGEAKKSQLGDGADVFWNNRQVSLKALSAEEGLWLTGRRGQETAALTLCRDMGSSAPGSEEVSSPSRHPSPAALKPGHGSGLHPAAAAPLVFRARTMTKKKTFNQVLAEWKLFIYNPNTREFLGRTAKSWGLTTMPSSSP